MSAVLVVMYLVGLLLVCAGIWWLTSDRAFMLFAGVVFTPEFFLERMYPEYTDLIRIVFLAAMAIAGFYFGRRNGRRGI